MKIIDTKETPLAPNIFSSAKHFVFTHCTTLFWYGALFVLAIWLRVSQFANLVILKSDQARDVLIMHSAIEHGFSNLPLLGPQIGGTELRLGPLFYYMQYAAGALFNNTIESYAYPDLLAGIMTIPLLALLIRAYCRPLTTFWLTSLASVSVFLITFSRFGWNPNSLPFFSTVFLLSLVYAQRYSGWKRGLLISICALAFACIAQLHLMAVMFLGLGTLLFLAYEAKEYSKKHYRPFIAWREVGIFIFMLLITQIPVFLSHIRTDGRYGQLIAHGIETKLATDDQSDNNTHTVFEKIFRSAQEIAAHTTLTLTGFENNERITTKHWVMKCDKKCMTALPVTLASLFLICIIFVLMIHITRNIESPEKRSRHTVLISMWVAFFLISIPLAYDLETRFFLAMTPIFFVSFGITSDFLISKYTNRYLYFFCILLAVSIFVFQFANSKRYLYELERSQYSAQESHRDLRFGTAPKVTLGQLRAIAHDASQHMPASTPLLVSGESLYTKALYSVLTKEYGYTGCYIKGKYTGSTIEDTMPFQLIEIEYTDNIQLSKSLDRNFVTYGTLSAYFDSKQTKQTEKTAPQNSIQYTKNPAVYPDNCLTY